MSEEIVKYVDIGKMEADQYKLHARVIWRSGKAVEIVGSDKQLVNELKVGVQNMQGEVVEPSDGMNFLYALQEAFKNYQMLASAIQEGEPSVE